MSLKWFLAELRHRGVLKVATAYLATGWVVMEGVSILFHNFEAPNWVLKVFSTLVMLGFPVACLMAWGFEFTSQGVHSAPALTGQTQATPRRADAFLAALLVLVFALVTASLVHDWRTPAREATTQPATAVTGSQRQPSTAARATADPSVPPSIAVLPFADMSAGRDQQYLGDGIAEELLNALTAVEGLNVAARTSSFSFQGKGVSVKEIGDTLRVRHVLEGSVRRSGQKLRVTAQLIDVESGFHLYSQSYDREVKDIFAIQNEIAREIVTALMPKLGLTKDANLVKQGTSNIEAYNLRLKAHAWVTDPDPRSLDTAVEQVKQAIALDRTYADAWGDLAYLQAYKAMWMADPVQAAVRASNAAGAALILAPTNVLALLTMAMMSSSVEHNLEGVATYLEQARAGGVDQSVWAFQKAFMYDGPLGRFDEAIVMLRDAERKDPLALNLKLALIEMYVASGRSVEAVAVAEDVQKLGSKAYQTFAFPAMAFLAAGDVQRARESMARLQAVGGAEFFQAQLVQFAVYAATGDREGARKLLDRLLREDEQGQVVSPYVIGEGYKALGEYDKALDWWTHAVELHHPHASLQMPIRNRNHPVLGKDPRFLALLRQLGLEGRRDNGVAGK